MALKLKAMTSKKIIITGGNTSMAESLQTDS